MELSNEECLRRSSSCPCLSWDASTKGEAQRRDTSDSLPEVAMEVSSSVSTDSDVPEAPSKESPKIVPGVKTPHKAEGARNFGKSPVREKKRRSKTALAMQMKLNGELVEAGLDSKPDIFSLIRIQLHRMNAVNLSTAMHRIAKLGGPCDDNEMMVLNALLNAIEKQTCREIENHDGSMPAKCATIIAWSCASIQARTFS